MRPRKLLPEDQKSNTFPHIQVDLTQPNRDKLDQMVTLKEARTITDAVNICIAEYQFKAKTELKNEFVKNWRQLDPENT